MQDLDKFKNEMNLSGQNVYVGHRYVPKIMGDWDGTKIYEPLSIVQNKGNSFTSRQYVPSGIELTNEEYWASTGNYNAQIEQYRQDVVNLGNDVTNLNSEVINARNGEPTLSERLDKEQQNVTTHLTQTANRVDWVSVTEKEGLTDADKFQAAIDSVHNNGTVYIPSEDFTLTKPVIISNKTDFKIVCNGRILIQTDEPAIILEDSNKCFIDELRFVGQDGFTGVGLQIKGNTGNNRIGHITGIDVRNYIVEVINEGTSDPYGNSINVIESWYSHGVIKDICDVPNKFGKEISVNDIRIRTNLESDNLKEKTPAAVWFRSVHDIQIENLSGEHKYTALLVEGDSNGHIGKIYASSYKDNTVITRKDPVNNYRLSILQMDEIYLWGVPSYHEHYELNYGLDISDVKIFNANNIQISNYDIAGLKQGNNGYFTYSDISFVDNVKDIEFVNQTTPNAFINFNHITTNHDQKGETVFYADCTDEALNNVWNTKCYIRDSYLKADKIFEFVNGVNTYTSFPNLFCYDSELLGNYSLSRVGRITPLFETNTPTKNTYSKGQIIYNSNPDIGKYTGWVFTGTEWKGFGMVLKHHDKGYDYKNNDAQLRPDKNFNNISALNEPVTVKLPKASDIQAGQEIVIRKNDVSTNIITVTTFNDNDVIESGGKTTLSTRGEITRFMTDGVSNWFYVN